MAVTLHLLRSWFAWQLITLLKKFRQNQKNNDDVRKFLGNFKLVKKEECKCSHVDMLIFRKEDKFLMVTLCDHYFDIIAKPGKPGKSGVVKHYTMQEDLYQRFKAFQVDWESRRQQNNPD